MLNRYTQGSGAECLKLSIVNAYKEGLWEKINVVNTIHDELNGSIPVDEEHIKDVMRMAEIMRTSMPNLRVPLEAEMELGDNWANTKTVDEWLEIKNTDEVKWNSLSDNLRKAILIAEKVRA
jgi:DNA polymerase-1